MARDYPARGLPAILHARGCGCYKQRPICVVSRSSARCAPLCSPLFRPRVARSSTPRPRASTASTASASVRAAASCPGRTSSPPTRKAPSRGVFWWLRAPGESTASSMGERDRVEAFTIGPRGGLKFLGSTTLIKDELPAIKNELPMDVMDMAFNPDGRTLYVAQNGPDRIAAYPLDPKTGLVLAPKTGFT